MASESGSVRRTSWWRGAQGEWLVVAQLVLMGLVAFGPRTIPGLPNGTFPFPRACRIIGRAWMLGGGILVLAGGFHLGRALTPLPYPRQGSKLVQSGVFALVRHPMYSAGLALSFGWALVLQSWVTFVYATGLFILLDVKSRREERWLMEKFPSYADYRRRVRKFVPFVY